MGMPPSVAAMTLANKVLGAMKKAPSHRLADRFSAECCVKNTQFTWPREPAQERPAVTRLPLIYIYKSNGYWGMTRPQPFLASGRGLAVI